MACHTISQNVEDIDFIVHDCCGSSNVLAQGLEPVGLVLRKTQLKEVER